MYSPEGCWYGAQLIAPKSVSCRWSEPSRFIDQTSATRPSSPKRRQTMREPSAKKKGPPSYPGTFVSRVCSLPSARMM